MYAKEEHFWIYKHSNADPALRENMETLLINNVTIAMLLALPVQSEPNTTVLLVPLPDIFSLQ